MAFVPSPAWFYLRPDETVIVRAKPEPGWFWVRALPTAFAVLAVAVALHVAEPSVAVAEPRLAPFFNPARVVLLAVAVAAAVRAAFLVKNSEYVVTDTRIYSRAGRLWTRVHFTTHDKITDSRYDRGLLDRLFGVSGLVLSTAGGDVTIGGIADALAFKQEAETARERFIAKLLERVPSATRAVASRDVTREAPSVPHPTPVVPADGAARPDYVQKGDRVLWSGKPTLRVAVEGALVPLPFAFFFAITYLGDGQAPSSDGVPPIVGALVLGVVTIGVLVRLLALKRKEFIVTDRRVYVRHGIVGTVVAQLTYDKITDIVYGRDIPGRLLGYGSLTVNTAGSVGAPAKMIGLRDALAVKEIIESARSRAVDGEEARA